MSRLATAFVLALAATSVNAQDTTPGQSRTPAVANTYGTHPFRFDGRMRGDGVPQTGAFRGRSAFAVQTGVLGEVFKSKFGDAPS
jgi:hypothetical protein